MLTSEKKNEREMLIGSRRVREEGLTKSLSRDLLSDDEERRSKESLVTEKRRDLLNSTEDDHRRGDVEVVS